MTFYDKFIKFDRYVIINLYYILKGINNYDEINIDALHEKVNYLININLDKRLIRIIIEENPYFIFEDINNIKENLTDIKNIIHISLN